MSRFFRDIRNELKKVIWPTRDQLINNTITVLMVCLLVGMIIWVSDEILTKIVEWTLTNREEDMTCLSMICPI